MTHTHPAAGQGMQEEASEKFPRRQGHDLHAVTVARVAPAKRHLALVYRHQAMVAEGHPMRRAAHKATTLDYYGGKRTIELQRASDLFDWSYPLHGTPDDEAIATINERRPYDLVVNVETSDFAKRMAEEMCGKNTLVVGPCRNGVDDLGYADDDRGRLNADREWISEEVTVKYPILSSGFIAEIFCRLAYLGGPIPPYKVPSADPDMGMPSILIATAASLPEKLWPIEKWVYVMQHLNRKGHSVGLLGAKPSAQAAWQGADLEHLLIDNGYVEDFRGAFTLPQVVGALSKVCAVLTLDNGILHLATAVDTPTVGLFRYGIHRLWAPPSPYLKVMTPEAGESVGNIHADRVLEAIESAL